MYFVVLYWDKGVSLFTVKIDGVINIGTIELHVQGMLGLCRSSYHESVVDRTGYDIYSLEKLEIMSH